MNYGNILLIDSPVGKVIASIKIDEDANHGKGELQIGFTDGTKLYVHDDRQQCCEYRYLHTDDDLTYYIGATLIKLRIAEVTSVKQEDYAYEHDVQFLHIVTSKGTFTLETHNEHNGYYGGFSIVAHLGEQS